MLIDFILYFAVASCPICVVSSLIDTNDNSQILPSISEYPLSVLRDIVDPIEPTDKALMFFAPNSGAALVRDVIQNCFNSHNAFNLNSETGEIEKFDTLQNDEKVESVDIFSLDAIKQARETKLADQTGIDMLISPFLHEAATIFTEEHKGRLFALFRHPIEREISHFYRMKYSRTPSVESTGTADMTLQDYVNSSLMHNNYLTRFLVHKKTGALSREDLDHAKAILHQKCLILLTERMDESINRMKQYFGWEEEGNIPDAEWTCVNNLIYKNGAKHSYPSVDESSEVWQILSKHNFYDIQLFDYAKDLFEEQGRLLEETNKMLRGSSFTFDYEAKLPNQDESNKVDPNEPALIPNDFETFPDNSYEAFPPEYLADTDQLTESNISPLPPIEPPIDKTNDISQEHHELPPQYN